MRPLKFKGQLTNAQFYRYRQSNFRWLLPAYDYCRAGALFPCLNYAQRFDYRALGSSRKLGRGAAEHLIDGCETRSCWLSFEFRLEFVCYWKGTIKRSLKFCFELFFYQNAVENTSLGNAWCLRVQWILAASPFAFAFIPPTFKQKRDYLESK